MDARPTGQLTDHSPTSAPVLGATLERRGRWWVFGSFILCPCHLPLTLAVVSTVLAGTSAGAVLRDHAWTAGAVVTAAWLLGTGYGFRLLRRAQQAGGACPVPRKRRRPA